MPINVQSAIVAEVIERLSTGQAFGALVFEDSVVRVLDSDDDTLPEAFTVIQLGTTEELDRSKGQAGSARERVTLSIVLMTTRTAYGPALRDARLDVKLALQGERGGLLTRGVQELTFSGSPETPAPPAQGRRFACHVMPLQITYVQSLK
ncbi:hypothetical protein [Pseudomonas sp. LRF_L74]|uniref:hypothetical protein n=1 Tax=Pseudomonas sp. LRF_L74 TaxID=3369422 RepID=UPI003F628A3E